MPGPPSIHRKPPPEGDGTPPPKKKRYWWRFSLASLIIIGVCAGATSAAILLYINSIAKALGHNDKIHHELEHVLPVPVPGGGPQTLLIIGSDSRPAFGEKYGRSDTTILLRLDAGQNLISVMSIPRDLKTEIPGVGTTKFNAAYSAGGPKLTIQVVKELTGLSVNHVINIHFLGFVRAVDAIGCVYTDVDVRYRHTDTDIVRSARQQSFLSQARHQVSPTDLITDSHNLTDILTKYTSSDIDKGTELITLLDLLYELRGAEVNQVHFPATLGPSYVYSNEPEIHHAVKEFLGEAGYESAKLSGKDKEVIPSPKPHKGAKKKAKDKGKHGRAAPKPHPQPGGDELVPAAEAGQEMAEKVARQVGGGFPVFYPTRLPPEASYQPDDSYEHVVNPWVYHLKDKEKVRHGAYRMIGIYSPEYEPTYFGVQGIQGWEDPPILEDPTETKKVNGREYSLYTDSGQIKLVAWHRGEDTYWISNSLQQSLTNEQMMGIAESCHVVLPAKSAGAKKSRSH
jgi:polyisoprenyl-teichoic acid--peptidoglycan teichoic acid transferase